MVEKGLASVTRILESKGVRMHHLYSIGIVTVVQVLCRFGGVTVPILD